MLSMMVGVGVGSNMIFEDQVEMKQKPGGMCGSSIYDLGSNVR